MFALFLFAGAAPGFVDDTFITLQYARNLVDFGAPLWHATLPKVEGFTSLAHVLVIAAGHSLGFGLIAWNSAIIILSSLLILAMFAWATRELSPWAAGAGLVVIASNAALLHWIGAGLDAVPYCAVFFASYLLFQRSMSAGRLHTSTALILILLGMTRPEGMFISCALLVAFWTTRLVRPLRTPAVAIACTGAVLVAFAAVTIWRVSEFGHPLPNTYYAKSSESRLLEARAGLEYLGKWIFFSSGPLLIFTFAALALGSRAYLRALFVVGQLGVVVLAGGDPHPAFRFFLPILPLLAMDLAWIVDRQKSLVSSLAILLLALFVTRQADTTGGRPTFPNPLAGLGAILEGHWPFDSAEDDRWTHRSATAAQEMGEILPGDVALAGSDVGALAFYSGLPILDTHGLNHPEISHLPKRAGVPNNWGNYRLDYLMDREVAFVHLHFPGHRKWSFRDITSDRASCDFDAGRISIMAGPFLDQLSEEYLCLSIPSQDREGSWLNMFMRKDRLDLLEGLPVRTEATSCIPQLRRICEPPD